MMITQAPESPSNTLEDISEEIIFPHSLEFAGFYLIHGKYQPVEPNEKGHLWSQELGLYLGIVQGLLRYFTPDGVLVPTPEESAEFEA